MLRYFVKKDYRCSFITIFFTIYLLFPCVSVGRGQFSKSLRVKAKKEKEQSKRLG